MGQGQANDPRDREALGRGLAAVGFGTGRYTFPDGSLDAHIRRYQRSRGLRADGVVAPGGPTEAQVDRDMARQEADRTIYRFSDVPAVPPAPLPERKPTPAHLPERKPPPTPLPQRKPDAFYRAPLVTPDAFGKLSPNSRASDRVLDSILERRNSGDVAAPDDEADSYNLDPEVVDIFADALTVSSRDVPDLAERMLGKKLPFYELQSAFEDIAATDDPETKRHLLQPYLRHARRDYADGSWLENWSMDDLEKSLEVLGKQLTDLDDRDVGRAILDAVGIEDAGEFAETTVGTITDFLGINSGLRAWGSLFRAIDAFGNDHDAMGYVHLAAFATNGIDAIPGFVGKAIKEAFVDHAKVPILSTVANSIYKAARGAGKLGVTGFPRHATNLLVEEIDDGSEPSEALVVALAGAAGISVLQSIGGTTRHVRDMLDKNPAGSRDETIRTVIDKMMLVLSYAEERFTEEAALRLLGRAIELSAEPTKQDLPTANN